MIADVTMFETEPEEQTERKTIPVTNGDEADDNVYLMGRPPLGKFLRFMAHEAANRESIDQGALTDEWRAAHNHIRTLRTWNPLAPS
ncbi:MAG: hypothetical protein DME19_08900 [Verrucomicrobia bacterium]|nr:MAG: hypothetical protein DME19_08900 [Verrucomicrobiota bacterium]